MIKKLWPEYMAMGTTGMGMMFEHGHHMRNGGIPNYLQMGSPGPKGIIEMSGMFTVLQVEDKATPRIDSGKSTGHDSKIGIRAAPKPQD